MHKAQRVGFFGWEVQGFYEKKGKYDVITDDKNRVFHIDASTLVKVD